MRLSLMIALIFPVTISAVLVGCASSPQWAGQTLPDASLRRTSETDRLLYSFGPGPRAGHAPSSSLLNIEGTLYGTAASGPSGNGLVFKLTPAGRYSILYSFKGFPDGAQPQGTLIDIKGTLYGATYTGGANNHGTVFSITPSGSEKVVYSFVGLTDGAEPTGTLLNMNGALYGTAGGGMGSGNRAGIVFRVTVAGKYTVLHYFSGGPHGDGAYPNGGLINIGGKLYGTTFYGGKGGGSACNDQSYHLGCGTVYRITTSGKETVLYSFSGPPDGTRPAAPLAEVDGTMYGTTTLGGSACLSGGGGGCGTVFSVDTSGKESVLYSFAGPPDGEAPLGLLALDGSLYGTTLYGGRYACHLVPGCGTVFQMTRSGDESVLHSFTAHDIPHHPDGEFPSAGLINVKGALVGTTEYGGTHSRGCMALGDPRIGCGTIFSVPAI